jgi:hypothetical protein
MTPKEFQAELTAIAKDMGAHADVTALISANGNAIFLSIYPAGMGTEKPWFSLRGDTFEEALAAIRAKWGEYRDEHERQMTRRMALRIIEITAQLGECTDAALRGDVFSTDDVTRYGARACTEANDIAGRGPFKLIMLGSSNGAPEVVEATV